MKKIIIIFSVLLYAGLCAGAQELSQLKVEADSAYAREDYEQAQQKYQLVADSVQDASVCYNLGCCYYRMDDMARAVLWFERAYLLNPGDGDIRFNLDMARSKTIDRITPRHEMFFVSWYRWLTNIMSLQQWAVTCIILFLLALVSLSVFFFSRRYSMRKFGFYLTFVFIFLTILGNVCAFQQRSYLRNRNAAIIVSPAVTVKSTPSDSGNDLFVLHEGTKVNISDNEMKEWCEVKVADGKMGWIQKKDLEII